LDCDDDDDCDDWDNDFCAGDNGDCAIGFDCSTCLCVAEDQNCSNGIIEGNEICEIDGIFDQPESEFQCTGRTYERCDPNTCMEYIDSGLCSSECGASSSCDEVEPDSSLLRCTFGWSYAQDYCDENCQIGDSTCESDHLDCTADQECDEVEPGEGDCTEQCALITQELCDTQGATRNCGETGCRGIQICRGEYWSDCTSEGINCGICQECNSLGLCTQINPECVCERNELWDDEEGTTGNQFRCMEGRTYDECTEQGVYEHVNVCKHLCSASLECDGLEPGLGECSELCVYLGD